jgi:hypothetical protein
VIAHQAEQQLWEVQPPALKNWQWILRSKTKDIPYREGEGVDAWVTGIYPKTSRVFVEGSNYGRLPISDSVRARYLKSLVDYELMLNAARKKEFNPPAPEVLVNSRG